MTERPISFAGRAIRLALSLAVSVAATTALADRPRDVADLDLQNLLDNVVVSASKHEETLEESPANVYIVTRAMIENYGCESIAEALALAPGMYITDDYSLTQIGIRGVSAFGDWNSHVMVLIDGRTLNEQYSGSTSIDVSGLDIDNIERIEVIKGPASSLYGSNAFFGLINLITRQSTEDGMSVTGRYSGGADTRTTSMELFRRFDNDVSLKITGSFRDQQGSDLFFREFSDLGDSTLLRLDDDGYNQFYLDSSAFTGGWARDKNTRRNFSTHSRLTLGDISFTLHLARLETGLAHSAWGSLFQRPENRYWEARHYADLTYQKVVSPGVGMNARLIYSYWEFQDYILYNYASLETSPSYLPGPIWTDWEEDRYVGAELRLDFDFSDRHRLIVGGEGQFHRLKQISGETESDGESVVENVIPAAHVELDGRLYNLYAQDHYRLTSFASVVGGVHFNSFSYTTGKVMPKGVLIVTPYRGATWKFIASRGFRSPTFYEMAFDDASFYYRNPELVPELIASYEVIVSQQFPYGLAADVAVNSSLVTDLIRLTQVDTTDPGHPGNPYEEEILQFRNGGEMHLKSVEAALRSSPAYRFSGFANLTWQEAVQDQGGIHKSLPNSPRWLANVGLTYQLRQDKLALSVKAQHISTRTTWDGGRLAQVWLLDAMLQSRRLVGALDIGVGVKNVFDKEYRVPLSFDYAPSTSIERPGRSAFLSLRLATKW
ncbi:MAG: TonB-dependent receptor [Candidatus Zixiibacteriota bacterium]